MTDTLLGRTEHTIRSGTAGAWERLIEELSKVKAGKIMVVMDGYCPQGVARVQSVQRLTENANRREVER